MDDPLCVYMEEHNCWDCWQTINNKQAFSLQCLEALDRGKTGNLTPWLEDISATDGTKEGASLNCLPGLALSGSRTKDNLFVLVCQSLWNLRCNLYKHHSGSQVGNITCP